MGKAGIWALVVAAGRGERLGLGLNKVFHQLAGRSVLSRCFDALEAADCFEGAVLVLSDEDSALYDELTRREGKPALVRAIAPGGSDRQQSVKNGLRLLPESCEIVAVHDAARAFVPASVVLQCVDSAIRVSSGVAATQITDTVKQVDEDGLVLCTLNRGELRQVQTPQAFRTAILKEAHRRAELDGYGATDDAALVEKYVGPVHLCCSEAGRRNLKLTTMEDLRMMEARLRASTRVGHGYDVHRLVEGRKLILCGVEVPYELGLLGHSDADVVTHALMDALLGACGQGDIGGHFPDSDPRYRGVSSMDLLAHVCEIVQRAGCRPLNFDITIVCERPKLAPFIPEMRVRLAGALGIPVEAASIKATTTEGLGFVGRGEGIEAHALSLVIENLPLESFR